MKTHIIKHVLFVLAIVAAFTAIVMFLWNLLIPNIFGFMTINFWQALGLLILARLFFGNINHHFRMNTERSYHHNPIREKWMSMTSEEREDFIRHRNHHGHGYRTDCFNAEKSEKESECGK